MTATTTKPRPASAARRVGYVVAVLVNAALVYVINLQPGWEDISFLTQDTSQVLWWVNLSLIVGIAANLLYMIHDVRRVKALGEIVTTALGLVATVRIWQVFPFDFSDFAVDYRPVTRMAKKTTIVQATNAAHRNASTTTCGMTSSHLTNHSHRLKGGSSCPVTRMG